MRRRPPADYAQLEENLMIVFSLLEGIADTEEARSLLSAFLEKSRDQGSLPPEYEEFLIRLFFDKCSKEFQSSGERDRGR